MAEEREIYVEQTKNIDINSIYFLDETSFNTGMTLPYGWGHGRVAVYTPDQRYEKMTLISTIGLDGSMVPIVIENSLDGNTFLSYITQCLIPSMQKGQTLILDNLSSHKVKGVDEAFEEAGINLMYLPPYSFDFDPIEHLWPKVKHIVKSTNPRSKESLIDAIGDSLDQITLLDIKGWFLNCGYSC